MRKLAVIALVGLLLPGSADAQIFRRRPRVGTSPRPAPLPPMAPGISPMRVYRSSRFSYETYPVAAMVFTDHYMTDTAAASTSMFGLGERIAFRMTPMFSLTSDITSLMMGAPFSMESFELGGRFSPERPDRQVRPFVDVRASWAFAYSSTYQAVEGSYVVSPFGSPYQRGSGASSGFGSSVGVGMDYKVTQTIAMTTGVSVMRNRMSGLYPTNGTNWAYNATTTRFAVGFKYNPRRLVSIDPSGPPGR